MFTGFSLNTTWHKYLVNYY